MEHSYFEDAGCKKNDSQRDWALGDRSKNYLGSLHFQIGTNNTSTTADVVVVNSVSSAD